MTDRTERAVAAANNLYQQVLEDLDVQGGGIAWWTPQIGWKKSALLGEYLLASCEGVGESILQAELATQQYKEVEHAQNFAQKARWREVQKAGGGAREAFGAVINMDATDQKRERLMRVWSNHALTSLAQSLDRVAAVVILVAGVKEEVLRTDWGKLMKLAANAERSGPVSPPALGVLADVGTPGRARQEALLQTCTRWQEFGPPDWLEWLRKSRNTATHRAQRMQWYLQLAGRPGAIPEGFTRPFWTQPDWAETEIMLRGSKGKGFEGILLPQRPTDIMRGLAESVAEFTEAILQDAAKLWLDRRIDPSLIVQHPGAWPNFETSDPLEFPGYGEPANVDGTKEIRIRDDRARRWQALRLIPDTRKWRD